MTKLKRTKHTKYFANTDEVEYVFGRTLTQEQRIMIQSYITTGVRPDPAGCWTCSPAAMRILTSEIDQYEAAVEAGTEKWPWAEKTDTPS